MLNTIKYATGTKKTNTVYANIYSDITVIFLQKV